MRSRGAALARALSLALACPLAACGTAGSGKRSAASAPAGGPAVPRPVFLQQLHEDLPPAVCKEGSYFRSCFRVTAKECDDFAWAAVHACLEKLAPQMPAAFRRSEEGAKWGAKTTACAGASYEVTLAARKIDSTKCSDPAAWR